MLTIVIRKLVILVFKAKKKMTASAGVQATADPSPVLTKVSMAQAKSLVKMITTQAAGKYKMTSV